MIETVFLDAGGVLVNPNWDRVAAALGTPRRADLRFRPGSWRSHTRRSSSTPARPSRPRTTTPRGWLYFRPRPAALRASRSRRPPKRRWKELAAYHAQHNLWESVPREVPDALDRLRKVGHRLVVVSNSNGTLQKIFSRLDLARHFDVLIDSSDVGVEARSTHLPARAGALSGARPETTLHAGTSSTWTWWGRARPDSRRGSSTPAGLYADHDVTRVPSLAALVDRLLAARADSLPAAREWRRSHPSLTGRDAPPKFRKRPLPRDRANSGGSMTTSSRFALAAAILLAVPAAAEADPRFGVRFGYYTEAEAAFLGAEMLFRIVPEIYFNPNVEAVFVDDGHSFTINGDFHYDFRTGRRTLRLAGRRPRRPQCRPGGTGRGRHRRRAEPAGRDRDSPRPRDSLRAGQGDPEERLRVRDRRGTALSSHLAVIRSRYNGGFLGGKPHGSPRLSSLGRDRDRGPGLAGLRVPRSRSRLRRRAAGGRSKS